MKKLILLVVIVFATYTVKAQNDVPSEVYATLTEKYPGVNLEDVDWETEDFYYQAEFEKNDKEHEVRIDKKGNLVSAHAKLSTDDIPADVHEGLGQEFGKYEVKDAEMFETAESTLYKFEVETEDDEYEVYTDGKGKIIEKSDG
ncbi:MAG: hypothetical protein ACK4ND_06895 [Cytophagaceae bacterium]